jgi:single-strand DNA-binding protein
MASFNKVLLMGNLTRDPELRYTPQGVAVCDLGLAVNYYYTTSTGERKEEPLFINIVVWRKQAESCATFLKKGRSVLVEGRLRIRTWQDKQDENKKHFRTEVVANRVQFIGTGPKIEGKVTGEVTGEEIPDTVDAPLSDGDAEEDIRF